MTTVTTGMVEEAKAKFDKAWAKATHATSAAESHLEVEAWLDAHTAWKSAALAWLNVVPLAQDWHDAAKSEAQRLTRNWESRVSELRRARVIADESKDTALVRSRVAHIKSQALMYDQSLGIWPLVKDALAITPR